MALPGSGLIRFARRGEAGGAADLLAALPTPVLAIDRDGFLTEANVAAEALINASRLALIGRHIRDVIGHPLDSMPIDQPVAAYDFEIVLPGGRTMRVDLMAAPLPDQAQSRTITIHRRASDHLAGRRMEREGGVMTAVSAAAMLAHEIKNPLSGIRGAAQLLDSGVDAENRALTRLIRDEVDRITALIDRMEGFTAPRPVALEAQNIHAVLGHVRDVATQGFAAGRTIREVYDPSLPAVLGHRDSLVQIFLNLVKNAVEATEDRPETPITLTTAYRHGVSMGSPARPGRRIMLPIEVCVVDEGAGAPASVGDHLFDPFVTSKRQGGGLGLALVDKLVGDHGGAVEYRREGEPARTVFRVLLPRAVG